MQNNVEKRLPAKIIYFDTITFKEVDPLTPIPKIVPKTNNSQDPKRLVTREHSFSNFFK